MNRTRGTVIGDQIELVNSWWGRLRGFLGRREPERGEGLLLVPCRHVHTFGMAYPLDLLFLSGTGEILEVVRGLPPGTTSPRVAAAYCVAELPVGTIDATGSRPEDRIAWTRPGRSTLSDGFGIVGRDAGSRSLLEL